MNSEESAKRRAVRLIGRVATVACLLMYASYIDQIILNFSGHPVPALQPLCAAVNASLWVAYGWQKPERDWPVIIANFPGIIFGLVTFITAFVH